MAQPSDFEYLAIEGGGGKGIAYSGGMRVLEKVDLLPITKPQSFKGISGASAGAITAFFISLGMTAKDIDKQVTDGRFKDFFEDPHPGVYKAVKVHNGKVSIGYATDDYDRRFAWAFGNKAGTQFSVLDNVVVGDQFFDQSEKSQAFAKGMHNCHKLRRMSLLKMLRPAALEALETFKLKKSDDDIIKKFKEKIGNPDLYFASLLMDRGLFSGISVREYFQEMAYTMLFSYYGNNPAFADIAQEAELHKKPDGTFTNYNFINPLLTFNKLKEITGKTLHITGTNLTQQKPVIFCPTHEPGSEAEPEWDTGDFPVIEAVCCSMNIPFAFKAIYVNYFAPNGKNYNGLYGDGGILYNTPIHIWDGGPAKPLNPKVLGLRVDDGYDPEDTTFTSSSDWLNYIKNYKLAKIPKDKQAAEINKIIKIIKEQQHPSTENNSPNNFKLFYDTPLGLYSIILKLCGYMFGLLFYWPERGQIRNSDEEKQTVLFYSYDVTILDFNPPDPLKAFLAQRAEEKLSAYFGLKP